MPSLPFGGGTPPAPTISVAPTAAEDEVVQAAAEAAIEAELAKDENGNATEEAATETANATKTDAMEVRGSLGKDEIRRVIRKHIGAVRYCYEKELAKDPTLAGTVKVRFIIGSKGTVASANTTTSSLENKNVNQCVLKTVKGMKFPKPEGGGIVVVNYPFAFKTQ